MGLKGNLQKAPPPGASCKNYQLPTFLLMRVHLALALVYRYSYFSPLIPLVLRGR
jgi:hypothetical protein